MDRRTHPRFVCEYSISFVGGNITGSGTVSNLSMGGCALESDSKLRRGDHMKLRINLPEQESPIQVGLATVRWIKGQESGLGFINLTQSSRSGSAVFWTPSKPVPITKEGSHIQRLVNFLPFALASLLTKIWLTLRNVANFRCLSRLFCP